MGYPLEPAGSCRKIMTPQKSALRPQERGVSAFPVFATPYPVSAFPRPSGGLQEHIQPFVRHPVGCGEVLLGRPSSRQVQGCTESGAVKNGLQGHRRRRREAFLTALAAPRATPSLVSKRLSSKREENACWQPRG